LFVGHSQAVLTEIYMEALPVSVDKYARKMNYKNI